MVSILKSKTSKYQQIKDMIAVSELLKIPC